MRRLFIYYSLTGNGDYVSNYFKSHGVDTRKVMVEKPLPSNPIFRILEGGFLASLESKSKLVNFNADVSDYDEVIIGSPVWNSRLSCPINSVLDQVSLDGKKVCFVLYSGSGKAIQAELKIFGKYPSAKIIHVKEPLKYHDLKPLDEFFNFGKEN